MLEKSPDHRPHPDILRQPGNARSKGADTTHNEVNLYPCRGGRIESSDNFRLEYLVRIIEKPNAAQMASHKGEMLVGMNSWSFTPDIFPACRHIAPSLRGELEIQDAVQVARDDLGVQFTVLTFHDAVLDLSSRGDIASVTDGLRHVEPRL